MTNALRLDELPSEILILIFNYCSAFDLVRLSEVCVRFYNIIHCDTLWIKKSKLPIVTNQASNKFMERCNNILCLRKKWQISQNWQDGKFKKKAVLHYNKLMPWIQLSDNILWWCGGNKICGIFRKEPHKVFWVNYSHSDICRFVIRNSRIISGHRDGNIQFWSTNAGYKIHTVNHSPLVAVQAVEQINDVLIGGTSAGVLKIWNEMADEPHTIDLKDRIWSMAGNEISQKVAVGCSGLLKDYTPLRLFDLETYEELLLLRHNPRRGAGILDIVWENPYIILTCGYDTNINKWDTRVGKCVASWADPTDATAYCLSSDYQYTMITGTQFNCKAVLWDQRQSHFVQLYFMSLNRISSPIYSICFDNCHLYGATDQILMDLDFSGKNNNSTNYRDLLSYDWNNSRQHHFLRNIRK